MNDERVKAANKIWKILAELDGPRDAAQVLCTVYLRLIVDHAGGCDDEAAIRRHLDAWEQGVRMGLAIEVVGHA